MNDDRPPDSLENPTEPKKDKEGDSETASPLEPEVLEKLPPEAKDKLLEFSMQAISAPIFHPITKKITEGHIDKVLDQAEKDSERQFKDRKAGRLFGLIYALIGAALFIFVTIFLVGQDRELYLDLLTKIIIFFGGGGLGYGLKAYFDRQ